MPSPPLPGNNLLIDLQSPLQTSPSSSLIQTALLDLHTVPKTLFLLSSLSLSSEVGSNRCFLPSCSLSSQLLHDLLPGLVEGIHLGDQNTEEELMDLIG